MDVVGFGESSVDHVYVVAELPGAGPSKLPIRSRYTSFGGQVATTMAACAALGVRAGYLGPIGSDADGTELRDELGRRGVDTRATIVRTARTRYAVILVDERDGERCVLWERDPRLNVPVEELRASSIAGARVVHVDAVDEEAAIHLARSARDSGAIVTCDVETVTARTAELMDAVSVAVVSPNVPQQLTGLDQVESALRACRSLTAAVLCVTLGSAGCAALDGGRFLRVPGFAVEAVDTTGAGDIFRAGIIYGLLHGWDTPRTLTFANAAAAVSCTRRGAIASVPDVAEVSALLSSL